MTIPAAVRSAIEKYAADWNAAARPDIEFDAKRLRLLMPHRLYRYMGEDRNGQADLGSVKPAGWRCFIQTTRGGLLTLDTFETETGFGFRLHAGNAPKRWLRVIRTARRQKRLRDALYSMSALVAPAVHLSYLWFSAPGKDHILAVEWHSDVLTARRWTTREEWDAATGGATIKAASLWRTALTAERPQR
jgi:hypothetical protein